MSNRSFEGVLQEVERKSEGCWDRTLPSTEIFFVDDGRVMLRNGRNVAADPTKYALDRMFGRMKTRSPGRGNSPHATYNNLVHLCTRPSPYGSRNYGILNTELFAKVANNLLHNFHPNLNWFARCRNGGDQVSLRAMLSDQFKPFDHRPFLEAVLNPQAGLADVGQVHRFKMGPYAEDLYLKVVFPDITIDRDGGTYMPGLRLINGELGNRRIGFDPFIYTKACTNDMVIEGDYSWTHQHRGVIPSNLVTANLAAYAERWLTNAVGHVEDLHALQDVEIPDLAAAVKKIAKRAGLTEENKAQLVGATYASGDVTPEGATDALTVVNGVTAFARQVSDADERDKLERLGGSLYGEFVKAMKAGQEVRVR